MPDSFNNSHFRYVFGLSFEKILAKHEYYDLYIVIYEWNLVFLQPNFKDILYE